MTTPDLSQMLRSGAPRERVKGLLSALELPSLSQEQVESIVPMLTEESALVRELAADTLKRVDRLPATALPIVVRATTDSSSVVRARACALCSLMPSSDVISQIATNALVDPSALVRASAVRLHWTLFRSITSVRNAVVSVMQDNDEPAIIMASDWMAQEGLGSHFEDLLFRLLRSSSGAVRGSSLNALAHGTTERERLIALALSMSKDSDPIVNYIIRKYILNREGRSL